MPHNHKSNIAEGLRAGDLNNYISDVFTIDRFSSKMGEDRDVLVLGFKVKEKYPAIDLMEFIEKGYKFILDADMSSGEEHDGQYQVFVEIERTPALSKQLAELVDGIGQLTKCYDWKYKYHKDNDIVEFNEDTLSNHIPMTQESYDQKILKFKTKDIQEFFNQGAVEITLESNNQLTFKKPYAGDLTAKFVAIGDYEKVKEIVPGALDLSESSQSQVLFLNKFLGNYNIDKIGNKFLIRNGEQAIVIEKDKW